MIITKINRVLFPRIVKKDKASIFPFIFCLLHARLLSPQYRSGILLCLPQTLKKRLKRYTDYIIITVNTSWRIQCITERSSAGGDDTMKYIDIDLLAEHPESDIVEGDISESYSLEAAKESFDSGSEQEAGSGKQNSSVHSGHRQRVKEEFLLSGIENFSDIRALEMLLFYAVPRRDTNLISHSLLNRFGSLQNVFSASVAELTDAGLTENAAILIRLVPGIARKALSEKEEKELKYFRSSGDIGNYIQSCFIGDRDERFILYCLDASLKLLSRKEVAHGVVNKVNVDIRRIVELALSSRCTSCIIAHNHPDGIPDPSKDDILVTERIKDSLALLGIRLNDHFIAAADGYYSFAEHGLL